MAGVGGGTIPQGAPLLAPDGDFYGTTVSGGSAGAGVIYRLTSTGAVTILHSFDDCSIDEADNTRKQD